MKVISRFFLFILLIVIFRCTDDDNSSAPDNKSPLIKKIAPASNALIRNTSPITLSADATDEDGTVVRVIFLIDNQVVGEDASAPFEMEWTPAESGHYNFSVQAVDDKGETAASGIALITAVGFSCPGVNICKAFTTRNFDDVVMAFYPTWKVGTMPINSIPWSKITHIIYSFALPEEDGELNTSDMDGNIDELVASAHDNGVKVYFSIGGGSGSEPFISLAENDNARALFVDRVACYIKDHCLDGVDIDWEHWNGTDNIIQSESESLVNLLADLRELLPEDKEISTDVAPTNWSGKHYLNGVVEHVTYVNAMLYDLRGPWSEAGPQSKYEEVISDGTTNYTINSWGLMYWAGYRHWPASKIVVGIPFYGRDFSSNKGDAVEYSVVVAKVNAASADINADKIDNLYYDGPQTASRKAAYARDNGYAGVMFWELTDDSADDETSLLKAIDRELND